MDKNTFRTPAIDRRKSPMGFLLWTLTAIAIGSGVGWFAHDEYQRYQADSIIGSLRNEIESRDRRIELLKEETRTMQQRIVALERSVQIDKSALQRLKEEISATQDDRLKLEEELIFLRGMVSKDDEKEGLRIRSFRIARTAGEDSYHYRFTITQTLGENDHLRGRIRIRLSGKQDGEAVTLELAEIDPDQQDSLKMGFKHFQDVEGIIELPEGFKPSAFSIEIKPDNEKLKGLTKEYEWVVSD